MPLTTYTAGQVLTAASLNDNFAFAAQSGLTLVKTQTIGSAVATVAVTGAFSATYDNYKIIVSGGVCSGGADMQLQLGATTAGYYQGSVAFTFAGAGADAATANGSLFPRVGFGEPNNASAIIDVLQPFLTTRTVVQNFWARQSTNGLGGVSGGFLDNATSYTDFTLSFNFAATFTGGTIRVYGYANS